MHLSPEIAEKVGLTRDMIYRVNKGLRHLSLGAILDIYEAVPGMFSLSELKGKLHPKIASQLETLRKLEESTNYSQVDGN